MPAVVFYVIQNYAHKLDLRANIGISSSALGLSSCFDAPFRFYKLMRERKVYGPLGDDVWYHADFTMWTYQFCLTFFAIPLIIAPTVNPVLVRFFLMAFPMLVLPFGLVLLLTLVWPGGRAPFRLSSDAKGEVIKPGMFYIIEDIAAVDFREGRAYRRAIHVRYAASPLFRRLMLHLTWYWIIATTLHAGGTAAVAWTTSINFSFAFVLGFLFIWAAVAALGCWWMVHKELKNELVWWRVVHKGCMDGQCSGPQ